MQLPRPVAGGGWFPIAVTLALAVPSASAQGPVLPDLPVMQLEQVSGGSRQPGTEPVARMSSPAELDGPRMLSLTFARALPIRDVLVLLVRDTPFSVVIDASVRATFSGELRNLTIRQALEAVLFPANLDYDVSRTVIRVFPARPKTRLFQLDLLAVRRSWQSRPASAQGAVVSAVDSDVFSEIDRGVAALLSSGGRHHVDRRASLVQVTDFADRLDQIAVYLEAAQLRATRQVRVDVQILRLIRHEGSPPWNVAAAPVIVSNPHELVSSLERYGSVVSIASPTLLTMNNEPVMTALAGGTLISLVVTPQISADGFVQLSVVPGFVDGGPDGARPAVSSDSDSIVRVREGQTAMISGLSGGLDRRGEWVVLLTPWLVNDSAPGAGKPAVGPGGDTAVGGKVNQP